MDATPIDFGDARPLAGGRSPMVINSLQDDTTLATTWSALHEAATTVGAIAGVDRERIAREIERGLAVTPKPGPGAHDQDIHDLADIMRRGISALLTAHTSGGSPQAAAGALWREFIETRDRMLAAGTDGWNAGLRA